MAGCDAVRPFANMKSKVASGKRDFLGGSLAPIKAILQNRPGTQHQRGNRAFFPREHLLVVVRIEIAPNHNAFNAGHCTSDHVMDMREELRNSDFTFLNVLGGLRFPITVSNQIAL